MPPHDSGKVPATSTVPGTCQPDSMSRHQRRPPLSGPGDGPRCGRTRPKGLGLAGIVGAGLLLAWGGAAPLGAGAGEIIEKHEDGKIKRRYGVDKEGRKSGNYVEYFADGKVRIRARYKAGELNGKYTEVNRETGIVISAKYKQGKLHGSYKVSRQKKPVTKQTWKNGKLITIDGVTAYPKPRAEINELVPVILDLTKTPRRLPDKKKDKQKKERAEPTPADPKQALRLAALRRLMAYRYLCDLAWEGMILDRRMNRETEAAARICDKIGKLDHKPRNPGLPAAEYKLAYAGTSHSNLAMGGSMERSVNMYMDDSNQSNIDRVGHRRWCLNPAMLKTGFGLSGRFTAMWSMDRSRKIFPPYDFIAYPARGYMPVSFFGPRHAWSVSLNPKKFPLVNKALIKVAIYLLDAKTHAKAEQPLKLSYFNVAPKRYGSGACIIFLPAKLDLTPGKRYLVEISGLGRKAGPPARKKKKKGKKSKAEPDIRYLVHFIKLGKK